MLNTFATLRKLGSLDWNSTISAARKNEDRPLREAFAQGDRAPVERCGGGECVEGVMGSGRRGKGAGGTAAGAG